MIKLTFLGTRGNTKVRSAAHRMHSSLLVRAGSKRIMIDCGGDWLGRLGTIAPDAILITHAHSDHSLGLKDGAPCPVYATAESWRCLERMPVEHRELVGPGTAFAIGPLEFVAVPVIHSPVAPAVAYRVKPGGASFFYVPDVFELPDSLEVLSGIDLYIGDGARLEHPIKRGQGSRVFGHASVREQMSWCAQAGISRAVFTHCGTPIIRAGEIEAANALNALARQFAIEANFARDGQEICLGSASHLRPVEIA